MEPTAARTETELLKNGGSQNWYHLHVPYRRWRLRDLGATWSIETETKIARHSTVKHNKKVNEGSNVIPAQALTARHLFIARSYVRQNSCTTCASDYGASRRTGRSVHVRATLSWRTGEPIDWLLLPRARCWSLFFGEKMQLLHAIAILQRALSQRNRCFRIRTRIREAGIVSPRALLSVILAAERAFYAASITSEVFYSSVGWTISYSCRAPVIPWSVDLDHGQFNFGTQIDRAPTRLSTPAVANDCISSSTAACKLQRSFTSAARKACHLLCRYESRPDFVGSCQALFARRDELTREPRNRLVGTWVMRSSASAENAPRRT
jgi:hypothetical protein